MTPTRNCNGALVDLLERVLDKGVIINADLIISLAGIPLVGVQLRAALAGMETMLEWGLMRDWDRKLRSEESGTHARKMAALLRGETILFKMIGACFDESGLYRTWRYGHLYVTDQRMMLIQGEVENVLFQSPLVDIEEIVFVGEADGEDLREDDLQVTIRGGLNVRLRTADPHGMLAALERRAEAVGI